MSYFELLAETDPMQNHWDMDAALRYIDSYPIDVVMEIGCYQGGSLATWSRALHPSLVVGVTKDEVELVGVPDRVFNDGNVIKMIFGLSQEQVTIDAVKRALDGRLIDYLFIDGGHSFADVQHDFLNYSALMSDSGIVGIHDVNRGCEGVYKFWEGYIQQDYRSVVVSDAVRASTGLGIGLVLGPAEGTWASQAAYYDRAPWAP